MVGKNLNRRKGKESLVYVLALTMRVHDPVGGAHGPQASSTPLI